MENINIADKIRKLLELSNNNPSEHEAIAAELKAQELMAKYDLTLEQVKHEPKSKKIIETVYYHTGKHEMKKWKYRLASTISNNFRCKTLMYGRDEVAFYGYEDDAKIALQVFTYLYEAGNRLAVRYYNQCRKNGEMTKGVMNTYLMGFNNGISSVLEKQCKALMIITPQEVIDSFEEKTKGWKTSTVSVSAQKNSAAFNAGKRDGIDVANARSISA